MVQINPAHPESSQIVSFIRPIAITYIQDDGTEAEGVIEMHASVVEDIDAFFKQAYALRFPIHAVTVSSKYEWDDDALMGDNITSGFNYRLIKGTNRPSLHGLGLAFDLNPAVNPYFRYIDGKVYVDPAEATYNPQAPGVLTAAHPLVTFMKQRGWSWGGDWTEASGTIDYQHFEKPLPIQDAVQ